MPECYVKLGFSLARGCDPSRYYSVRDVDAHPSAFPPEFSLFGSAEGVRKYLRLPLGGDSRAGNAPWEPTRSYEVASGDHTVIWREEWQQQRRGRIGEPPGPQPPAPRCAPTMCRVALCDGGAEAALEVVDAAEAAGMTVAGVEISHVSAEARSLSSARLHEPPRIFRPVPPTLFGTPPEGILHLENSTRTLSAAAQMCAAVIALIAAAIITMSHQVESEPDREIDGCVASCSRSLLEFCVRIFLVARPDAEARASGGSSSGASGASGGGGWARHLEHLAAVPGLVDPSAQHSLRAVTTAENMLGPCALCCRRASHKSGCCCLPRPIPIRPADFSIGNGYANCFLSDPRALLAHARAGKVAHGYLKVAFRLADGRPASSHAAVNAPGGDPSPVPADLVVVVATFPGLQAYVGRRLADAPPLATEGGATAGGLKERFGLGATAPRQQRGGSAGHVSSNGADEDEKERAYMVRGRLLLMARQRQQSKRPQQKFLPAGECCRS